MLARLAYRKILPLVARITETRFPVPRLEVIGDISHFATQTDVEELIPVSEFFKSGPSVVNTAEANTGRDWETRPIGEEVWNRRVRNRKWIKRIGKWYADSAGTEERPC